MRHSYGWKPQLPDMRDWEFMLAAPISLPPSIDLRPKFPPPYDQGQCSSCTGNAIAGAIEFDRKKRGLTDWIPSRLFIYFNEREMEGSIDQDSGASIRDGVKSVASLGACSELDWPYDISQFAVRPPDRAYADAKTNLVATYHSCPQVPSKIKGALIAELPIVLGITLYDSFESDTVASTGVVSMPSPSESVIGGHAVVCVGYDDKKQVFIIRNSWGSKWGMDGYFTLPYSYLLHPGLASDFWIINALQGS